MAPTGQLPLPASFTSSLADFQTRLTAEQIEEFQFATFQSLQEAINNIQKEQAHKNSFRNLNKIRPFLNGLSQYSKVIELFINMEPLLAAIWGPIKFCLQVASNLNQAFDTLLDAYEKIGSALPIIKAIDTLFYTRPPVQQVLVNVFEDILTFHKRAIVFFSKKTWKLTFRMTLHTFPDLFGDVLKNLERSRNLLMQSASIAHFEEAQEARIHFTKEFEGQAKRYKQEQRVSVVEWLSADQTKHANIDAHTELQRVRAANPLTTQWLFNTSAMRSWMRKSDVPRPVFWLSGIPGAGKTVLFSSVVDKIPTLLPEAQAVYFYCKCNDDRRRTFEAVIRTLIVGILDLSPSCLDYLHEKMIASSERHLKSEILLQDLFEELCTHHDLLFICIDGLDECEPNERASLLSLLGRVTKTSGTDQSVRFFVTSRKETDIERSLSSVMRLNIKPQHVEHDIGLYIRGQTARLRCRFRFGLGEEQSIREKLTKKPQGMFLLARLITDNLLAQDNRADFDEEMDSKVLPDGIDQAYNRIMVRLSKHRSEKSRRRAKFILEIIASATRALRSHEIQGALSIRLDDHSIDFARRRAVDPLNDICGPIIEIHANGVVDMIHPTAKSYLLQHHSGYFIDAHRANLTMTRLCVAYLTFSSFDPALSDINVQEHTKTGCYSFQDYATCNWIHHMEAAMGSLPNFAKDERTALETSYNLLRRQHVQRGNVDFVPPEFLQFPKHQAQVVSELRECRELYDIESIFEKSSNNGHVPYLLYQIGRARQAIEEFSAVQSSIGDELFTSAYGTSVYKCPKLRCSHFDDGFGTKSLRDAHYQRHERPFKCEYEDCDYSAIGFASKAILTQHTRLCHSAPSAQPMFPKISRCPIDRALRDAIGKDDALAVRTLAMELLDLEDAPTGFLIQAIQAGRRKSAQILMEVLGETDEMNHRDSHGGSTALHILVEKNDEELVSALLNTCVAINVKRKSLRYIFSTPLQIAVSAGLVSIVRILLEHKQAKAMLIESKASSNGASILSWAVQVGNSEILELLLCKGWEIYENGIDIMSALNTLVYMMKTADRLEVNKKLLGILLVWGRVLKIEAQYPQPYRQWVLPKVDDMIPVFMGEVNIEEAWESSKKMCEERIQEAILEGDIPKTRLLLKATGVHYISSKHGTVLAIAALYGMIDIVRKLIEDGEDIHETMNNGNSALENAAAGGSIPIVQLLLENGANVNEETKDLSDGTALQCAAANGHETMVQLLLGAGAKIEMHGTGGRNKETALVRATNSLVEAVVLLLLEHGADLSAKSDLGESVLHLAARRGHQKLALQLILSGAAVDELTPSRETVLMIAAENGLEVLTRVLLEHDIVKQQINLEGEGWIDADGYDSSGSALLRAASNGHPKVVKLLLEAGAGPDHANLWVQTPLQVAEHNGHGSIVMLLRSYGATS